MPAPDEMTLAECVKTARDLVRQVQESQEFCLLHYNLKPDGRRVMTDSQPMLRSAVDLLTSAVDRIEPRSA